MHLFIQEVVILHVVASFILNSFNKEGKHKK